MAEQLWQSKAVSTLMRTTPATKEVENLLASTKWRLLMEHTKSIGFSELIVIKVHFQY